VVGRVHRDDRDAHRYVRIVPGGLKGG
jgi:hypothetical protein